MIVLIKRAQLQLEKRYLYSMTNIWK